MLKQQSQVAKAKSSAVFNSVAVEDVENLFKFSHVKNYKKGEFLFMKEDKIENFYLLLDGMLKKSIIEENGNEAVIDIIIDSGIIFDNANHYYTFNCNALEDSTIICFSATEFKKLMQKNNVFLMNLFLELSKLNHSLTKQITSLKLADNKNKLAQLLLKTSIKNGKKSQTIDLEYSKTELASYLGMRIETLSRVLRQLQNEGEILVNRDKITLNKKESLCSYCNDDIFKICAHKHDDFCKH